MTDQEKQFFQANVSDAERARSKYMDELKSLTDRELQELQVSYLKEIAFYSKSTDSNINFISMLYKITLFLFIGLVLFMIFTNKF